MAKTKTVKTKVLKPKVVKVRQAKRMSKRYQRWEVWSVFAGEPDYDESFNTQAKAQKYIKANSHKCAPVIVHIDIPPMEY